MLQAMESQRVGYDLVTDHHHQQTISLFFMSVTLFLLICEISPPKKRKKEKKKSGLLWWLRWQRICLQFRRPGFNPWVRNLPWRRKWPPTPIFLPGKSHGQRTLAGYHPWGRKDSDMTERLTHTLKKKSTNKFIYKVVASLVVQHGV